MAISLFIVRGALQAKKAELLRGLQNREEIQIPGRAADPLDEAAASSARVTAVDKIKRDMVVLKAVDKALGKFANWEFYGECETCGELIPDARLAAVPWAELCIHCQHEKEIREGENRKGDYAN